MRTNPSNEQLSDAASVPGLKTGHSPRYEINIAHHSLQFSSAHFLVNHQKCGRLHGHNYGVSVLLAGTLNEQAMVTDFGQVKQLVQEECALLDHKILIPLQSPFLKLMLTETSVTLKSPTKKYIFPRGDCVLLDIEAVTSELLAAYFWKRLAPKLGDTCFSILIEETPGSIAKYGAL
jgi:6-pyruvoyltetrahydropterin/6-carboxytetrahydropterin synthase